MNSREVTYRLRFTRTGCARFLSHLDLMRMFQRGFRRALLPLARSRGKTPRPRVSLPYPLPLGVESTGEILEAELEFAVHGEDVRDRLNRCLPAEIDVIASRAVLGGERRALAGMRYEFYGTRLPEPERLEAFMKSSTCIVERKRKDRLVSIDIRPYVSALCATSEGRITADLEVHDGRSTRPDEVLTGLGVDKEAMAALRIVRTAIHERPQ